MADQNTFDVNSALSAGASEDDVLTHLTQSRPYDIQGAMKAGASKRQIIDYLATQPRKVVVPGLEKLGDLPPAAKAPTPDELQGPPEEQAPTGLWDSFKAARPHPLDAIREWYQRPEQLKAAFDALHVERKAKSENRTLTAEEQSIVDLGNQAHIALPDENTALLQGIAGPATTAGKQALSGDVAGSIGTLAGGYGVPAVAGIALPKVPGAARAAARIPGKIARGAVDYMEANPGTARIAGGLAKGVTGMAAIASANPFAALAGTGAIVQALGDISEGIKLNKAAAADAAASASAAPKPPMQGPQRTTTPVWLNSPEPTPATVPDAMPIASAGLPSGRVPGSLQSAESILQKLRMQDSPAQESTSTPAPAPNPVEATPKPDPVELSHQLADALGQPEPEPAAASVTPEQTSNRTRMAVDLGRFLHKAGYTADDAAQYMGENEWAKAAEAIDALRGTPKGAPQRVQTPKPATRAQAIEEMRRSERLRDAMAKPPASAPSLRSLRKFPPPVAQPVGPYLNSPEQ